MPSRIPNISANLYSKSKKDAKLYIDFTFSRFGFYIAPLEYKIVQKTSKRQGVYMSILSILTLIGGLAMFLYGMNVMGDGLLQVSGGKLDSILERLTSNKFKGVLLGAAVTAVIQSSSVTTVMVIGFVNSGIMKLTQAVGVIMGANIGTTVTSWLLSLTGISGNGLLALLKPSSFSPILAIIGVIMLMTAKGNSRRKEISSILLGFAVLMFGMTTMSGAVEPLADNPQFTSILTLFSNPVLGVLVGALLTAIIQSSSASIGILQALCITGAVPYSVAIPVIMGQNIGTCVTALISVIGAGKNAKRASMIHLYFNLIGTIVFMAVFYALNAIIGFSFLQQPASVVGVATVHSLFNIGCCIVWLPFSNLLVKLATLTIPDEKEDREAKKTAGELDVLEDRFLEKPAFAVHVCRDTSIKMAELARDAVDLSIDLLREYSPHKAKEILSLEARIDQYQAALGEYLMKLNNTELMPFDNRQIPVMLQCIMDFERIADHAANIEYSMDEMHQLGESFSSAGREELMKFAEIVQKIIGQMLLAYRNYDSRLAEQIEPYEEIIDKMSLDLKKHRIDRLQDGECSLESCMTLEDILTDFERIYVHCANVSMCIIRNDNALIPTQFHGEEAAE